MYIDEIKSKWILENQNKEANISFWNEKADYFGEYIIPTYENDEFIKTLKDKNVIEKGFKVLDVGCGGGKHTIGLSKYCNFVQGVDLSPKMIEYANKNKEDLGIQNVSFNCENWHEIDIEKSNLYKGFDLVFASMTPAIQSYDTFQKLLKASKKYCVLRCSVSRKDLIYDKVANILGIENQSYNMNFLNAMNSLYLSGYTPSISYEYKKWDCNETLEKTYSTYINKIKSIKDIEQNEEDNVKRFLEDISEDGYIKEKIESIIATIIWYIKDN